MTDSPTKMAMNTIVCHAGAMSGRFDGREARFASAVVSSRTAVWETKSRHQVALLMMQECAEKECSILHSALGSRSKRRDLINHSAGERWLLSFGNSLRNSSAGRTF